MTSKTSKYAAATVVGCILALAVIRVLDPAYHYSQLLKYTERNYMRGRKNERKLRRYGCKLSDHELRLQKVEGFGR